MTYLLNPVIILKGKKVSIQREMFTSDVYKRFIYSVADQLERK